MLLARADETVDQRCCLLRCMSLVMAQSVVRRDANNMVAIGLRADIENHSDHVSHR
jgi:hypothetical protein